MLKILSEEKRALAAEAVGKAEKISKRWERLYPQYADELRSSALWGAVRAASSYDDECKTCDGTTKKDMWERWLRVCVNSQAMKFLQDKYFRRRVLWTQDGLEAVVDDREIDDEQDCSEAMQSILRRLTKRQREICELVYLRGMTPHKAGETLGIRPENACRLHRGAIERLRSLHAA